MGLLGRLFGKEKSQPYVDAGMTLTFKLCRSLNLPDCNEGLPNYTPEEIAAIDRRLSEFQKMANEEMGGEAKFHPDAAPKIQRMLAGEALYELAWTQCLHSDDEIPSNWKSIASTYLKAWASRLDPQSLIGLSDLLARVGYKSEAKEAAQVILFFPTYAKKLWGKNDAELLRNILDQAKASLRQLN